MEPSNRGMPFICEVIALFIEIVTGCQIPHCLQIFHRDIQEATDHFTNKKIFFHYVCLVVCLL